ncbi:hypothetical protein TRVA0_010S01112 [Trichomonascus vanleenenianus]|uniref:Gag1p n=1 Tax=Trichomonascus vanleenenianus TaxID=2268995 RepID=UPI003ECB22D7
MNDTKKRWRLSTLVKLFISPDKPVMLVEPKRRRRRSLFRSSSSSSDEVYPVEDLFHPPHYHQIVDSQPPHEKPSLPMVQVEKQEAQTKPIDQAIHDTLQGVVEKVEAAAGSADPDDEQCSDIDDDNVDEDDDLWSDLEEEEEEERINPAYKAWKRNRRIWTHGTHLDTTTVEKFEDRIVHGPFKDVPERNFPSIYRMLVKESRHLKEPINLADAIRVIKAGWIADGTWPTNPTV